MDVCVCVGRSGQEKAGKQTQQPTPRKQKTNAERRCAGKPKSAVDGRMRAATPRNNDPSATETYGNGNERGVPTPTARKHCEWAPRTRRAQERAAGAERAKVLFRALAAACGRRNGVQAAVTG